MKTIVIFRDNGGCGCGERNNFLSKYMNASCINIVADCAIFATALLC